MALLLSRADVAALLDLDDCIDAVEAAFRSYGRGEAPAPGVLGTKVEGGGFHLKAGLLGRGVDRYFVAKANANFRHGRPTIQGVILLCDARQGRLLAVMDSIEITAQRTGAATAVAARYLARPDAETVAIVGCGAQGRVQLRAVSRVRQLRRVLVWDREPGVAPRYAAELGAELGVPVTPVSGPGAAARESDICITCTPSTDFLLGAGDVPPGALVAGVGADRPDKRELAPALLARATVVCDAVAQCAEMGDLHHAIEAGALSAAQVHAELGEIVAGRKPGRRRDDEIVVFDSTGMALQDAAAAALVYRRAVAAGRGTPFDFAAAWGGEGRGIS
jgi:ornithine cyclodeaminase/alanine dehydrogenase-like protein (mu-crystallin family)